MLSLLSFWTDPAESETSDQKFTSTPATNLCCFKTDTDSVSLYPKDTPERSGASAEESGSYWVTNILLAHTSVHNRSLLETQPKSWRPVTVPLWSNLTPQLRLKRPTFVHAVRP
jgi:hypothetical protein